MSLLDDPESAALNNTAKAVPAGGDPSRRGWTNIKTWPLSLTVGVVLLVIILVILLLTPLIAPYDPATQDLVNRLSKGGDGHPLGTDQLGRDVLSRLMWGGRFSVSIAAITLAICAVSGTLIGIICARRRRCTGRVRDAGNATSCCPSPR